MPTIAKVADRKLGIDYGYVYQIASREDLEEYWESVAIPRWQEGFRDCCNTLEWSHANTTYGNSIRVLADTQARSPVEVMGSLMFRQKDAMESLLSAGPLFVNRNGGFFPFSGHEIKEVRESDTWILPGATLKISQWPNGKHFYARIGDEDVVENGRNKWDSHESAQRAGERFARNKNIAIALNFGRLMEE